jgi:hypothetical protein
MQDVPKINNFVELAIFKTSRMDLKASSAPTNKSTANDPKTSKTENVGFDTLEFRKPLYNLNAIAFLNSQGQDRN